MFKKSKLKKESKNKGKIVSLHGLSDGLMESIGLLGAGHIMTSTYGVDMAKRHPNLAGLSMDHSDLSVWPEIGVLVNGADLQGVYAVNSSPLGAPMIECDFKLMPAAISFYFEPESECDDLFSDLMDIFQNGQISPDALRSKRIAELPVFNTCPCCIERAERIKDSIEMHPISRILTDLSTKGCEADFELKTKHTHMIARWKPEGITYFDGQINAKGGDYTLRVNAMIVHALRVYKTTRAKQEYTHIHCYNSFGQVMLKISAEGAEHESRWNELCSSDEFNYCLSASGAFLGI
ncbi:MAG: hypothetical protein ACSHX0_00050 [Akkermansiaceae bacterium]